MIYAPFISNENSDETTNEGNSSDLAALLVGNWKEVFGDTAYSIHTFKKGGHYSSITFIPGKEITMSGTWAIKDDILIYNVDECSEPNFPVSITKDKILEISDGVFRYRSIQMGGERSMTRIVPQKQLNSSE